MAWTSSAHPFLFPLLRGALLFLLWFQHVNLALLLVLCPLFHVVHFVWFLSHRLRLPLLLVHGFGTEKTRVTPLARQKRRRRRRRRRREGTKPFAFSGPRRLGRERGGGSFLSRSLSTTTIPPFFVLLLLFCIPALYKSYRSPSAIVGHGDVARGDHVSAALLYALLWSVLPRHHHDDHRGAFGGSPPPRRW